MIDLGRKEGLSGEQSAMIQRGAKGLPWLWPCITGGALLLGLAMTWTLGFAPGRQSRNNDPPELVSATRSEVEDRGAAKKPSDDAHSGRYVPPARIAQESRLGEAGVVPIADVPKATTSAAVPELNTSKPSLNIMKASVGNGLLDLEKTVVKPALDIRQLRRPRRGRAAGQSRRWPTPRGHLADPDGGQTQGVAVRRPRFHRDQPKGWSSRRGRTGTCCSRSARVTSAPRSRSP